MYVGVLSLFTLVAHNDKYVFLLNKMTKKVTCIGSQPIFPFFPSFPFPFLSPFPLHLPHLPEPPSFSSYPAESCQTTSAREAHAGQRGSTDHLAHIYIIIYIYIYTTTHLHVEK